MPRKKLVAVFGYDIVSTQARFVSFGGGLVIEAFGLVDWDVCRVWSGEWKVRTADD